MWVPCSHGHGSSSELASRSVAPLPFAHGGPLAFLVLIPVSRTCAPLSALLSGGGVLSA